MNVITPATTPTYHRECNRDVATSLTIAIGAVALGVIVGYLGKLYFDKKAQKALDQGDNVWQVNRGLFDVTIQSISPEALAKTMRLRGKIVLYTFSTLGVLTGGLFTLVGFNHSKIPA